jgi:methanogenic corrinoid protein MtbC1
MIAESNDNRALPLMREFENALLFPDRVVARSVLVAAGLPSAPLALVEKFITPVLEKIGTDWERGDVALSQVYLAGRICEELVDELLPPGDSGRKDPRMAIAVLEDFHSLGKRIVYSALRASGFQLADYGHRKTGELVERTVRDGIKILLVSALMLPSALKVKQVREGLERAGADVKIVVGGAPFRFDDLLWREVGADASARTASGAVELVKKLWRDLQ